MPHRLPAVYPRDQRLGRRGASLLVYGVLCILIGFCYAIVPVNPIGRANLTYILWVVPDLRFWGAAWGAIGLTALISAFFRVGKDGWGFIPLFGAFVVWGIAYLAAAIAAQIGAVVAAPQSAFIIAFLFLVNAAKILIDGGWNEPLDVPQLRRDHSQ